MSEQAQQVDSEKGIDPIDEVLTIETPTVNDALGGKKKKTSPIKIGLYVFAGSILALLVYQGFFASPPPRQTAAGGVAQTKMGDVSSFRPAPASEAPVNSEAAMLAEKKEKERAEAAAKDPQKSFVSQDPFGSGNAQPVQQKQDNAQNLPPPPSMDVPPQPTPGMPQQSNNGQEDPTLTFARKVYVDATYSPRPGLSAPRVAQGVGGNTAGSGQYAQAGYVGQNASPTMSGVRDATVAAGEIKYAVLTSGLNTLVPQTPPRAVIHGGPLDGGVILGIMENANDQYMVLRFKSLTLGKKTYAIEAIAVNPEMQDAGLVDEAKSHLLEKTAIQAGVGFIQSFGAAKLQEGSTTSVTNGANGSSTYTSTPERTNKQTAIIALGGAAQAISPAIDQAISTIRPEVIIRPNKEMGILFLKPFYLE